MGRLSPPAPLRWQTARIADVRRETPRASTLAFDLPAWPGHRAGQHVDVRLTAEDGYRAQRSYSIASPPGAPRVEITVERLDDGEVSPWLAGEARAGDEIELRGPIGGYFVWEPAKGGPLLLLAGGSGLVPLMCIERHRRAAAPDVAATLLVSARGPGDLLYAAELEGSAVLTYTREQPPGWTASRAGSTASCSPRSPRRPSSARAATSAGRRASSRRWRSSSSPSATTAH